MARIVINQSYRLFHLNFFLGHRILRIVKIYIYKHFESALESQLLSLVPVGKLEKKSCKLSETLG